MSFNRWMLLHYYWYKFSVWYILKFGIIWWASGNDTVIPENQTITWVWNSKSEEWVSTAKLAVSIYSRIPDPRLINDDIWPVHNFWRKSVPPWSCTAGLALSLAAVDQTAREVNWFWDWYSKQILRDKIEIFLLEIIFDLPCGFPINNIISLEILLSVYL